LQINGAGATFPYPINSKWFAEYEKQRPNVAINYQSIGSGGGIRRITAQTVVQKELTALQKIAVS
jgi:phosphate transport system substrate-binding protein